MAVGDDDDNRDLAGLAVGLAVAPARPEEVGIEMRTSRERG